MIALTPLEQDALTEIFNIGFGLAADAICQMLGEHVPLSVPVVELTSLDEAKQNYMLRESRQLYAVRQTYTGEFTTDAVLMFPEENGGELVRMMVGADMPAHELASMQKDALAEIGNILLNAVISNLSSNLNLPLEGSLPVVTVVSAANIFAQAGQGNPLSDASAPVLALMIDFALSTHQVQGYLVFLMDVPSIEKLRTRLAQYM